MIILTTYRIEKERGENKFDRFRDKIFLSHRDLCVCRESLVESLCVLCENGTLNPDYQLCRLLP